MPILVTHNTPTAIHPRDTGTAPALGGREAIVHAKPGFDPSAFMRRMAQRTPSSAPRTTTELARWSIATLGFDIVAAARSKGVLPDH